MEKNMMNLQLSEDMIKPIIENHIKAGIMEALGGSEQLLSKLVSQIINTRVDKNTGKPTDYSYNSIALFDYYFTQAVTDTIREAINEQIKKKTGTIKKAIIESLKSDEGANKIANSLLSAFEGTLQKSWTSTINIDIKDRY